MALVLADRVQETSTTVGTGTFTLLGAVSGFQSFSAVGDGNTTYYTISGGAQWEVGIGTYTAAGTTLSRDTVLSSSSGGAKVDFAAGQKYVFVTYPEDRSVYVNGSSVVFSNSATVANNQLANSTISGKALGTNLDTLTLGSYLTGTSYNGSAAVTAAVDATSANTASKVVARDGSGNFSAGTITASLTGTASTATNIAAGAQGSIPYQSAAGTTAFLAKDANATRYLSNTGTTNNPAWAQIDLTNGVTGTLPIGNGGTGATTLAGANIPELNVANTFTGANTFRTTSGTRFEEAATQDAIIIDGRAGGTASYAVTIVPTTLSASRTLTLPNASITVAGINAAQTFTSAQTFRAANAIRSEAASTQDAVIIAGRAGGTSSYAVTLTPTTLTASRTLTLPDASGTILQSGTAVTVAQGGTGVASLTAYALLAGGTTSTGNLQQVSGTGTSGQVLTSNGASALPTWQTSTAASKGFSQIMSMVFGL